MVNCGLFSKVYNLGLNLICWSCDPVMVSSQFVKSPRSAILIDMVLNGKFSQPFSLLGSFLTKTNCFSDQIKR